ncbi:MAG: outer membrane protein assembly factor BamD [candidate division NC10 bacterium]|nr:outer membrane protein assembly factor BamD [candidate division NC10 bacterium]
MIASLRARTAFLVLLVPLSILLGSCANPRDPTMRRVDNDEALFWRANLDFMKGRYEEAREQLRTLVTQFPESPLIPEARLGIARTYFQEEHYEQARAEYERFLSLYPRNERVDEALYYVGLTYFRQIERADRDQTASRRAVVAFRKLLSDVPDTQYREDAEAKIAVARRRLATHEIDVGLFYLKRDKFNGAVGRFQGVIDRYNGTGLEPMAFFYLGETYAKMEEKEKAQDAFRQLLEKYPDSLWAVVAGDRLGVKVVLQSRPIEDQKNSDEETGGIWDLFKESWEDIKATFKHSLKPTPE